MPRFNDGDNSLYIDRAEVPNPKNLSRQELVHFDDSKIAETKKTLASSIPWQLWGILLVSSTFGIWLFMRWLGEEWCYSNRWICESAGLLPFVILWGTTGALLLYIGARIYNQWGLAVRNQIIRGREGTPISIHLVRAGILPDYFERMEMGQRRTAESIARSQPYGNSINNLNVRSDPQRLSATPTGVDGLVQIEADQPETWTINQLRRWLLEQAYHFMIVGSTQTGKTTAARAFIKWCVDQGYLIDVISIKARLDEWGFPVIGAGRNVQDITKALAALDQELSRREQVFAQLTMADDVESHLPHLIVFIDEILALSVNVNKNVRQTWRDFVVKFLTVSAGLNVHIVFLTQSGLVEALGVKNMGDVRKNLGRLETQSPIKGVYELAYVQHAWSKKEELIWIEDTYELYTTANQLNVPEAQIFLPRPLPDLQVDNEELSDNLICAALEDSAEGLTIAELVEATGFYENYVRGQIKRLKTQGRITVTGKRGSSNVHSLVPSANDL